MLIPILVFQGKELLPLCCWSVTSTGSDLWIGKSNHSRELVLDCLLGEVLWLHSDISSCPSRRITATLKLSRLDDWILRNVCRRRFCFVFPWPENPESTYTRHTETLDSCFDLIWSHQKCIPWSPPLEIKPATTDCWAETLQQSHLSISRTSDAKLTSHGNCAAN